MSYQFVSRVSEIIKNHMMGLGMM